MNRKLHNSLLAFSVTGTLLIVGLMAASPSLPRMATAAASDRPTPHSVTPTPASNFDATAQARIAAAAGQALAAESLAAEFGIRAIEAQARRQEHELDHEPDASPSLGSAIASTAAFAAAVSAEAAVSAALDVASEAEKLRAESAEKRRHAREVRSIFAVPYFSFAQGLRRNGRS